MLHLDQRTCSLLKLTAATVIGKAARGDTPSINDSEQVVNLARMVGQREAMVEDGGNSGVPTPLHGGCAGPGTLTRRLAEQSQSISSPRKAKP